MVRNGSETSGATATATATSGYAALTRPTGVPVIFERFLIPAIFGLIPVLLTIGPVAADNRKQAGIVIQSARWSDVQHTLTVTGYNAGRHALVQIRYAIDDSSIGRTHADDTGQWQFKMHRLQIPPCRVRVTNGTSSADMAVRDAPTACRTLAGYFGSLLAAGPGEPAQEGRWCSP